MANLEAMKMVQIRIVLHVCTILLLHTACHDIDRNRRGAGPRFSIENTDAVSGIILQSSNNKVILNKEETGAWIVNEMYEADEVAIEDLLSVLRNAAIRQPVQLSQKDQTNELIDSMGIIVKVYSDEYRLKLPGGFKLFPHKKMSISYHVGPESANGESTIMRPMHSSEPYEIHIPGGSASLRSRFTPDESFWRNPVIIDLQADEIQTIETIVFANRDESFRLSNKHDGFRVFDAHGNEIEDSLLHHGRLISYIRSFYGLFYESLLDEEELADIRHLIMDEPFMTISVTDQAGNKVSITCYHIDVSHAETLLPVYQPYDPNRFVLQMDHQDFAIAQFLVFNRIQRPLSYFLIR